jgi:hypothetical protein
LAEAKADFEILGAALLEADASAAPAIVRERRLLAAIIERLEEPEEESLVSRLAKKRTGTESSRPPARRSKS